MGKKVTCFVCGKKTDEEDAHFVHEEDCPKYYDPFGLIEAGCNCGLRRACPGCCPTCNPPKEGETI